MATKTTVTDGPTTGTQDDPHILKQGRTFGLVVTARDKGKLIDLLVPPRTGRSQLRKSATDLGPPVATFVVDIRTPQSGGDRGKADVSLGATVSAATANPPILPGLFVADVEFVNNADADDVLSTDVFFVQVVPESTK